MAGGDEEVALVTLTAHRKIIDNLIVQHHGRFVDSAGDSINLLNYEILQITGQHSLTLA
jgi:hypothetical protein